jgi:hypothetical protein
MKLFIFIAILLTPLFAQSQEFTLPIRVNSDTVRDDKDPAMHVGRNGSIYVSWIKLKEDEMFGDIYFSRSDDKGVSFLPSIRVTVGAEISPNLQRAAHFAIDIAGNIHMVWTELRVNEQHDIWYTRSTDDGMTWTTPVAVSDDSSKYLQDFPGVACDSSGNTYISWIDSRDKGRGLATTDQLYMTKSTDNGNTWASPRKVNVMPNNMGGTCECCKQDIQAGKNGVVALVFRTNIMNRRDIFAARSTDFGETFAEVIPIQAQEWKINSCPSTGPNSYLTTDGDLHVTWRDSRTAVGKAHVYYDVLPIGQTETLYKLTNNVRIDGAEGSPNYPDVSFFNDFVAISYETSTDRASYLLSNTDMSPVTSSALLGDGDKTFMAVEFAPDGTRYFAWQDQGFATDDIVFVKDTMPLPALSVKQEQKEKALITPNPVRSGNIVTIAGDVADLMTLHYSLIDMLGQTVYEGLLEQAGDRYNAIIPKLSSGQYILNLGLGRTLPLIVTN